MWIPIAILAQFLFCSAVTAYLLVQVRRYRWARERYEQALSDLTTTVAADWWPEELDIEDEANAVVH